MGLTQVSTDGVKNDAITKVKIPANQIEASELADNAVDTNAIANDAVTTAKIADGNVTTDSIADGSVNAGKLANNAVTTSKILDTAVSSAKIADGAITTAKLASGVQTTINNNADNRVITGSGTANTLEGEAGFTFVAGSDPNLTLSGSGHPRINLTSTSGSDHTGINFGDNDDINAGMIQYTNSNNAMQFHTNGGEKVRIDSTGRMTQNGTTSADTASALTLKNGVSGNDHTILELIADPNHYSMIYLGASDDRYRGQIRYKDNDHFMSFHTNNTERLRIQSGGGISFNGDTAAANALDDYEEGSFTPKLGGTANSDTYYVDGSGTYIKIGRKVTLSIRFSNVNLNDAASGDAIIFNLPFAPGLQPSGGVVAVTGDVQYYNVPFGTSNISNWYISSGQTRWAGLVSRANNTWIGFPASDFHANNLYINFSGTYFTT